MLYSLFYQLWSSELGHLCCLMGGYWSFRGTYCLNRQHTTTHNIPGHKTNIFTTMRNSNHILFALFSIFLSWKYYHLTQHLVHYILMPFHKFHCVGLLHRIRYNVVRNMFSLHCFQSWTFVSCAYLHKMNESMENL